MKGSREVRRLIENAEQHIQRETANGNDAWLACFGSVLGLIQSTSELHGDEDDRLNTLISKRAQTKKEFGWNPPQEIREQLLNDLRNLLR